MDLLATLFSVVSAHHFPFLHNPHPHLHPLHPLHPPRSEEQEPEDKAGLEKVAGTDDKVNIADKIKAKMENVRENVSFILSFPNLPFSLLFFCSPSPLPPFSSLPSLSFLPCVPLAPLTPP